MKKKIVIASVVLTMIVLAMMVYIPKKSDTPVSLELTLKNRIVVLDPGHGGLDNGAIVGNTNEDELNLKICEALKIELEARGAKVYLTRTDDHDMTNRDYLYSKQDDMYLRVRQIDAWKPDYLLSIHLNASPSSSAWGSQVFYYNRSTDGKELAKTIHTSMKEVTGSKKPISGSNFMVLRATKTLGVLIECGFISNANERGQLRNTNYHAKLSKTIVDGLETYNKKYGQEKQAEIKKPLQ